MRLGPEGLELIDQRRLPSEESILVCRDYREVAGAIRDMAVRGAPAIGVAAAYGMALAAREASGSPGANRETVLAALEEAAKTLAATRPTAVNLFWALDRMMRAARADSFCTPQAMAQVLQEEANRIKEEDLEMNRRIGLNGRELIPDGATVLTHCNAGALATSGYGTALGVIRAAREQGKAVRVYADETRPLLQGARLTTWELMEDGIPVILITDSMAGHFMQKGEINLVIVGADRIAANGDVANKIGTYGLAVLAKEHGIPFYVAAPASTIDMATPSGDGIAIEERSPDEVKRVGEVQVAPPTVTVRNPAFDVTPNRYITGIITDRGLIRPPYDAALKSLFGSGGGN